MRHEAAVSPRSRRVRQKRQVSQGFACPARRAGCPQCGITQDVRDFAAQQGIEEADALAKGMEVKAVEFVKSGAEVYRNV